jgi:hypothetical protein
MDEAGSGTLLVHAPTRCRRRAPVAQSASGSGPVIRIGPEAAQRFLDFYFQAINPDESGNRHPDPSPSCIPPVSGCEEDNKSAGCVGSCP